MYIYKIQNDLNGKCYVGLTTTSPEKRWREHVYKSSSCTAIHNAIVKYGVDNFTFEVIDYATDISELKQKESYWIQKLNSFAPNGYNLTFGGEHPVWSEESRKKLSETEKGHPVSEETRRKMSIANKGRKMTPEQIERLRQAKIGSHPKRKRGEDNPLYGKKRSPEIGRKIAETKYKPVVCIETNEVFNSVTEGAKSIGVSMKTLSKHLCGGSKSCGGYHWRWAT